MIDLLLALSLALADGSAEIQSGKQGKGAPPAAPAAPVPAQDGERPSLSVSELKLLKDSNIFAPRSAKRSVRTSSKEDRRKLETPQAPPKPKPPVVTGIFFDAKTQAFVVVVEDRNSDSLKQFKEPKFLKAGDEVVGFKVASVTAEKAVFTKGDVSKELKVGEAMPGTDGTPVSAVPSPNDPEAAPLPEGEEKVEIKPQDAETNTKTLEEIRKKVGKKNRPSKDE